MSRFTSLRRRGLSLAEAIVALAICAALLACMAVAFSAAGNATEMNDHFYRSLQQARTCMDLVTTTLRRCQSVTSVSGTQVTFVSGPTDFNGGDTISITYYPSGQNDPFGNPSNGCITLSDTHNGTVTTSFLIGESSTDGDSNPVVVSSASFSPATGYVASNGAITLNVTVQVGKYPIMNQITLSGSAAPRVNLTSAFQ